MRSRKILAAALTATLLLLTFIPCAFAYNAGVYRVTAEGGAYLYPTAHEGKDFVTIAPQGALLNVTRTNGDFGFTKFDSAEGWITLNRGAEEITRIPTYRGDPDGSITGIRITQMPDKLTYSDGEERADITGLAVTADYPDGHSEEVTGYNVVFPSLSGVGEKTASVWYKGLSAEFTVRVERVPVFKIEVAPPDTVSFPEGVAIDLSGMKVRAFYTDGRGDPDGTVLSRDEYTVSGVTEGDSSLKAGVYRVTVTYKYPYVIDEFEITVTKPAVKSLRIRNSTRITVYKNHEINPLSFDLEATYDNGDVRTVKSFDMEYDSSRVGAFYGTLSYGGKTVSFPFSVIDSQQTGITADVGMGLATYRGDAPDFTGLTVMAVYDSGDRIPVTDYTLSHHIDINTVGEYTVTAISGSYQCTFKYFVVERTGVYLGDVDADGKVTAADARLALRVSARLEEIGYTALLAADVNFDRRITADDARKILRVSAKLEEF